MSHGNGWIGLSQEETENNGVTMSDIQILVALLDSFIESPANANSTPAGMVSLRAKQQIAVHEKGMHQRILALIWNNY